MAGYGSKRRYKGSSDNVGKGHLSAAGRLPLQRPGDRGKTEGTRREVVWRMSPYERRRRGNALPGGLQGHPGEKCAGQRGSGYSAAGVWPFVTGLRSGAWRKAAVRRGPEQTSSNGEGCESTLESPGDGGRLGPDKCVQSRDQNRTREIRPSGIAGRLKETWPMAELGTHLAIERAGMVTLCLQANAPSFYPDKRTGLPVRFPSCNPFSRFSKKRFLQRLTTSRGVPSRVAISTLSKPVAARRTMRARTTSRYEALG
jgi:hypothetical protein